MLEELSLISDVMVVLTSFSLMTPQPLEVALVRQNGMHALRGHYSTEMQPRLDIPADEDGFVPAGNIFLSYDTGWIPAILRDHRGPFDARTLGDFNR